ncbi:hypothetical protein GGS20DRAFT_364320 [Poronia punctata]|nr:hypothetical protein GGS20DRAFT_364320 [Poronia punctata]
MLLGAPSSGVLSCPQYATPRKMAAVSMLNGLNSTWTSSLAPTTPTPSSISSPRSSSTALPSTSSVSTASTQSTFPASSLSTTIFPPTAPPHISIATSSIITPIFIVSSTWISEVISVSTSSSLPPLVGVGGIGADKPTTSTAVLIASPTWWQSSIPGPPPRTDSGPASLFKPSTPLTASSSSSLPAFPTSSSSVWVVSSRMTWLTVTGIPSHTSTSSTAATTPGSTPPPSSGGADSPPVYVVIAVSVSLAVFLFLATFLLRQYAVRRRQRQSEDRQFSRLSGDTVTAIKVEEISERRSGAGSTRSSSHSISNTYQSMNRGEVRIMPDRFGMDRGGAERLGAVPPGPPGHYYYTFPAGDGSTAAESNMGPSPNRWSSGGQHESTNAPQTSTSFGSGRGGWDDETDATVGRAY